MIFGRAFLSHWAYEIKTTLNAIYINVLAFGIPKGNPARYPRGFRNKRLIDWEICDPETWFQLSWSQLFFEAIRADELTQKVDTV